MLVVTISPVLAADSGKSSVNANYDSRHLVTGKGNSPPDNETPISPKVMPYSTPDIAGSPYSSPHVPHSIDPVNLVTGNYYCEHQDLSTPGDGLPLIITRSYNSMDPFSGPFGPGWTFNYNMNLTVISGNGNIVVKRGDGRQDLYILNPDGTYSPPLGLHDKLIRNADTSYTLETTDQITYLFTPAGQLARIGDSNRNTISLTYTGNYLTRVTDASGNALTFTNDAEGRIISITDATGSSVRYTYDGNGNLIRFSDAMGGEFSYTYDNNHWMTSISDLHGVLINNTYDENGRVISQSWPPSAGNTIHYDANNRMTTLTDSSGSKTVYTYNERGWTLSETDEMGNIISYAYDDSGNRIDTTDTIGNFFRSACNAVGIVIRSLFG
jgi:YD repeat-containing protein